MPERALSFRRLLLEDLDAVLELERLTFSSPWRKEQYTALMRAGICLVFGALRGESLLAYASASVSAAAGEMELYNIAVSALERRRGLGRRLLLLLLDMAGRLALNRAVLEVRAGNVAARHLYEKTGFTVCGLRRLYYSEPVEDAVLYEYGLGRAVTA